MGTKNAVNTPPATASQTLMSQSSTERLTHQQHLNTYQRLSGFPLSSPFATTSSIRPLKDTVIRIDNTLLLTFDDTEVSCTPHWMYSCKSDLLGSGTDIGAHSSSSIAVSSLQQPFGANSLKTLHSKSHRTSSSTVGGDKDNRLPRHGITHSASSEHLDSTAFMKLGLGPHKSAMKSVITRPILENLVSLSPSCNMNDKQLAKFRTQICPRKSNHGSCWLEERCPFSHCLSWHRRNPMITGYRPSLCPNVMFCIGPNRKMRVKNHCHRGRLCLFSHTKEEQMYHPLVYKSQLCRDWPECTKHFCPFAHGTSELRSGQDINFALAEGPEKPEEAMALHQASLEGSEWKTRRSASIASSSRSTTEFFRSPASPSCTASDSIRATTGTSSTSSNSSSAELRRSTVYNRVPSQQQLQIFENDANNTSGFDGLYVSSVTKSRDHCSLSEFPRHPNVSNITHTPASQLAADSTQGAPPNLIPVPENVCASVLAELGNSPHHRASTQLPESEITRHSASVDSTAVTYRSSTLQAQASPVSFSHAASPSKLQANDPNERCQNNSVQEMIALLELLLELLLYSTPVQPSSTEHAALLRPSVQPSERRINCDTSYSGLAAQATQGIVCGGTYSLWEEPYPADASSNGYSKHFQTGVQGRSEHSREDILSFAAQQRDQKLFFLPDIDSGEMPMQPHSPLAFPWLSPSHNTSMLTAPLTTGMRPSGQIDVSDTKNLSTSSLDCFSYLHFPH